MKLEKYFNIIIFIPITSFIIGFFLNENSAGVGPFAIDSGHIRDNINIFLNNNLKEAILHPDLFGNRTPLVYVIHKLINPFFGDYEKFRIIVFLISLIGPIILFKLLVLKFQNVDKNLLFLLSSIVYLSPYYRTSAYWGLNENYGLISTIISFFFPENFIKSTSKKKLNIFFIILFSSLTVYFDLKLLITPIICFCYIIFNNNNKIKFFTIVLYSLFSLPYLYLIYKWNGIVPPLTQIENPKTITALSDIENLYFINIGYAATLIGFYLFPFILFVEKNIYENIKEILKSRFYQILILIIISFILYNALFFDFVKYTHSEYLMGLGVIHKLSIILTKNFILQEIITYLFFLASFLLLVFFYKLNKFDAIILVYFLIISIFLWPLMQEYFDPIIIILCLAIFKSIKKFNKINSILHLFYFSLFLIIANIYYY